MVGMRRELSVNCFLPLNVLESGVLMWPCYTVYGGAMTAEDIKLPVPADLGFTGSAIVLKADSLEDAWKIIKGDVYYQEAVVSGILPQPLVRTHSISRLIQLTVGQ